MVISFRVLYKLRQRSIPCVGRTAVFCGQSRHVEVERGICSVLVVGGVVEVGGGGRRGGLWSVCGWASGGRQGDLWSWLYVGWIYTHMHISILDPDTLLFL